MQKYIFIREKEEKWKTYAISIISKIKINHKGSKLKRLNNYLNILINFVLDL